ncbi:MAG: hypothetical protein LW731_10385 [Oxalobacteraceae bacterium]|nr:hypothetical protein [Oxalobacteraceae bacterium]
MKIFLLASALVFTCVSARAEWVAYQRHAEAEEFHEATPVSREQGRITLWTLTDYLKPITTLEGNEVSSEKVLTTIDCESKKMGSEQVIRYAGKQAQGTVVNAMETKLRLASVRTGSTDAVLLEKLCR